MQPRAPDAVPAPRYITVLLLLSGLTLPNGGHCRALHPPPSKPLSSHDNDSEGTRQEQCELTGALWKETTGVVTVPGHEIATYRMKVLPLPRGGPARPVSPEEALRSFSARVYRCCQMGFQCRGVRGIQGHRSGDFDMEFYLLPDVLLAQVVRAEIHLSISNPLHLKVEPRFPSLERHGYPTRYSVWPGDGTLKLWVDLLFLFQGLQEAIGGSRQGHSLVDLRRLGGLGRPHGKDLSRAEVDPSLQDTDPNLWGEGNGAGSSPLELNLLLHCSKDQGGGGVPCENSGVHLLHAPFIVVSYR
ncbi:hypothetical protein GN956_G473 [Arapaima gigas]